MIGTYFEYEFSDGTTVVTSDVSTSTLNVDSSGVRFTWSISDPGQSNLLGHFPVNAFPGGTTDGSLVATVCGSTPSTPQDEISLAMTDPNLFWEARTGTQALRLDFFAVAGTWDVVFHKTNNDTSAFQIVQTGSPIGPSTPALRTSLELIITSGNFNKVVFTTSDVGALIAIDDLEVVVNCFCEGTRIATPEGDRPVETLKPGDLVTLADGSETRVKWLGEQSIETRLTHPRRVNPICIKAGAIADNVPQRDLFLSGDHAIAIDGYLINANALLNGQSIFQVRSAPRDGFTYYHIETDAHDLVLAENTPSETYIDYLCPQVFDNAETREANDQIAEMPLPRIASARMVPQAIRKRLKERAVVLQPLQVAS